MKKLILLIITIFTIISSPTGASASGGEAISLYSNNVQSRTIFEYPDEFFDRVLGSLDLSPGYLEPNAYVGLYWDCSSEDPQDDWVDDFGRLYLLWTSDKTSSSSFGIYEFTCNGKTYTDIAANGKQYNFSTTSWGYGTGTYVHATQIHTSIDDWHYKGVDFNTSKYDITNFKARLDPNYATDTTGQYNFEMKKEANFDFKVVPKYNERDILQLCTLSYAIIDDCVAQSYYDLNFGGYYHQVFFNTPIDIDRVYRVDVSYKLDSDDKKWYQLWAKSGEISIVKSLTTEVVGGGLFGLSKYQGFEEGSYAAYNGNTIYKYKMHLNYDSNGWNWFDKSTQPEEDYQKISDFEVLRLNFIMTEQEYDVAVYMDTVDGTTVSIFDPTLITNTETDGFWDILDNIQNFFSNGWDAIVLATKLVLIFLCVIAVIYIVSFIIKIIQILIKFVKGVPIGKKTEPKVQENNNSNNMVPQAPFPYMFPMFMPMQQPYQKKEEPKQEEKTYVPRTDKEAKLRLKQEKRRQKQKLKEAKENYKINTDISKEKEIKINENLINEKIEKAEIKKQKNLEKLKNTYDRSINDIVYKSKKKDYEEHVKQIKEISKKSNKPSGTSGETK